MFIIVVEEKVYFKNVFFIIIIRRRKGNVHCGQNLKKKHLLKRHLSIILKPLYEELIFKKTFSI